MLPVSSYTVSLQRWSPYHISYLKVRERVFFSVISPSKGRNLSSLFEFESTLLIKMFYLWPVTWREIYICQFSWNGERRLSSSGTTWHLCFATSTAAASTAVSLLLIILTWDILSSSTPSGAARWCHRPHIVSATMRSLHRSAGNSSVWLSRPARPQGEHMSGLTLGCCCGFPPPAAVETSSSVCAAVTAQGSMTSPFHASPSWARGQPAACPAHSEHLTLLWKRDHKDTQPYTWDGPRSSLSHSKIFINLFTLGAKGRTCQKGVFFLFLKPLRTSTRPSLGKCWATGRLEVTCCTERHASLCSDRERKEGRELDAEHLEFEFPAGIFLFTRVKAVCRHRSQKGLCRLFPARTAN